MTHKDLCLGKLMVITKVDFLANHAAIWNGFEPFVGEIVKALHWTIEDSRFTGEWDSATIIVRVEGIENARMMSWPNTCLKLYEPDEFTSDIHRKKRIERSWS